MNLDKSAWYVRWYLFSANVWFSFFGHDVLPKVHHSVDQTQNIVSVRTVSLCSFVNVCLFGFWIPFLLHALVVGVVAAEVAFLISLGIPGLAGFLIIAFIVLIMAGVAGTVMFLNWFTNWITKKHRDYFEYKDLEEQLTEEAAKRQRWKTFFQMVFSFLKSIKDRTCPILKIVDPKGE